MLTIYNFLCNNEHRQAFQGNVFNITLTQLSPAELHTLEIFKFDSAEHFGLTFCLKLDRVK